MLLSFCFVTLLIFAWLAFFREGDFLSVFLLLALFFMVAFYAFPLSLIMGEESYVYAGRVFYVTQGKEYAAIFCAIIFLAGFGVASVLNGIAGERYRKISLPGEEKRNVILTRLFFVFCAAYLVYLGYSVFDSERTAHAYAVRLGEVQQGDRVSFLISLVFGAIKWSLIIAAVQVNKRWLAVSIALLATMFEFYGAVGRMALMTNAMVVALIIFRLRAITATAWSIIIFFMVLPLVVELKRIIFAIAYFGELPDLVDLLSGNLDKEFLIQNFAHPVVSIMEVPSLIALVGYRYFYDCLQGILFYLKFFNIEMGDSLTYYNTYNIIGVHQSVVPPGYLAFGYVQLSYLGVFLAGAAYFLCGKLGEWIWRRSQIVVANAEVSKFLIAFLGANSFYVGEVRILVMTLFLPLFFYYFVGRHMVKVAQA